MSSASDIPLSGDLPQHVAIIMDGNGRWAQARGMSRTEGHRRGADAARKTIEAIKEIGIPFVTIFAFSSENWNRPDAEVGDLMDLMRHYLRKETAELHKTGARLRVIGQRDRLPRDVQDMIQKAEDLTRDNTQLTVQIALSYGGRDDIVTAARRIAKLVKQSDLEADAIDETVFSNYLMTAGVPDPDLLIRTSGEARISNFLLWQCAYAEFYFTETLWPDFGKDDVLKAIQSFQKRNRRFGAIDQSRSKA